MCNRFLNELTVAVEAAHAAGEYALRQSLGSAPVELKDDGTPVTYVDRITEQLLREVLLARYPLDGVVGEEAAEIPSQSGRRWIVDPIDGTRDYVRATGRWAVLVGLEDIASNSLLAGVVHFPALGDTYTAITGQGASRNNTKIHVSSVTCWSDAIVHVNNLMRMAAAPYVSALLPWLSGCFGVRNLGGALDAMMVASGKADVWLDPITQPWDLAPLKLIIEEAGGRLHSNNGDSTIYGGNVIAYTPALASRVELLLKPA